MKKIESLINYDIDGAYIKEYALLNKTLESGDISLEDITKYNYEGDGYVTNYHSLNHSEYNLDEKDHTKITDIKDQIDIIIDSISNDDVSEKTEFNESIDSDDFIIHLEYAGRDGYYAKQLIDNIEKQCLDESSDIYVEYSKKKSEILKNE